MAFFDNTGSGVKAYPMNSSPAIGAYGYIDPNPHESSYRIYYEVMENDRLCGDNCNKCIMNLIPDSMCAHAPNCRAQDRPDKKNVYFKGIQIDLL